MRDAGRFEHADHFQAGVTGGHTVEEALTGAEYHRVHLEVDLVDQTGPDRLPGARGTARDGNGTVTGGLAGLPMADSIPSLTK